MSFKFCLVFAAPFLLQAQIVAQNSNSVSIYSLRHKTVREARRLCDEAVSQLKRCNYSESRKLLEKALTLDSNYWLAQNNLGFTLLQMQQVKEAQAAFERAIQIDPLNAIGYTNLSVIALTRNNFALAEKSATESLRLDPTLPEAKSMLGLAMVGQGIWTPTARKLLEESRQMPTSEAILAKWPKNNPHGPQVVVVRQSGFQ